MAQKNNLPVTNTGSEYPKFAESIVEIMDIIKYKGGLGEVIKQSSGVRKFKSDKITFSEMDGKKHKNKKTVSE